MAKSITDGKTYIELEHTIGLNINCNNPVHYVSKQCNENEKKESSNKTDIDYLFVSGSSIVLSSFCNPHFQKFIRGTHITSSIACCEISPNKNLIASSENGNVPDVYIWSTHTNKLIYTFEEHNKTVQFMSFSLDSRFLITIDILNEMYIWDLNTGYIVTKSPIKSNIKDIKCGGRVKDIKRRSTTDYLFATCGIEQVCIWALTPSNGKLLSENLIKSPKKKRTFNCLCFSDGGDLLIAGTLSGDFFIFDVRKLSLLTSYQINCVGGINCII
eukprot:193106_1